MNNTWFVKFNVDDAGLSMEWSNGCLQHMGDCQNYGPFLGPYYNTGPDLGDPKRDHNFDNPPYVIL